MKKLALCALMLASAAGVAQTANVPCSAISVGPLGALNGFVPSPQDAWHRDVTSAPVDPNSVKIINTPGDLAGLNLHPDFSSIAGGNAGIPYNVVDTTVTPKIPVNMTIWAGDSDITLYPIAPDQLVENAPGECPTDGNDRHAVIIDRNQCVLYELYQASNCKSAWSADNGAIWDLTTTEHRIYGATSADAAGLSVFEGLIRYDEIVAGQINHAIRFTANHTKNDNNNGFFTAPATHAAGSLWGTDNIMGMRIRLRPDFDISGYSQTNQIILKAMKQYGMILADNGGNMFFQGTPDARWNDDDLNQLKYVPSSAFDVVQMDPVYDSSTAPTGAAPTINSFTASSTTVAPGGSVTLSANLANASYSYIDNAGFLRGNSVTVNPTATTTYTLTSKNAFGASTSAVTVTVAVPPPAPAPAPKPTPAPAPAPAGPSVKSITVTRNTASTVFALVATAKMSDGTTKDVTKTAIWHSNNPAVVVAAGLFSFEGTGLASVTAQVGTVSSPSVRLEALVQVLTSGPHTTNPIAPVTAPLSSVAQAHP